MTDYECIGFLTDYGTEDAYAAVCGAVMNRQARHTRVIDITHDVPPQDVRRGAAVLAEAAPWFAPAVLIAVVDPGVGTARRPVAVEAGACALVGPDNGLLSWAWDALGEPSRAVTLTVVGESADHGSGDVSATFHGRDVFAPAAGRLAAGADLTALGAEIDPSSLVRLPQPLVRRQGQGLVTEVLTVDRFGNVQLAARPPDFPLPTGTRVRVGGAGGTHTVPYERTFADVPPGEVLLLADSAGRLALAANGASAQVSLGASPGDLLTLEPVTR